LGDLNAESGLIRLLRSAVLAQARSVGRFTFRDVAIADGAVQAREGENSVSVAMIIGAVHEGDATEVAATTAALTQALADIDQIVAIFSANGNGPPDFDRLRALLARGLAILQQAASGGDDAAASADYADNGGNGDNTDNGGGDANEQGDGGQRGGGAAGVGRLRTRADAKRALEQISAFLERTEPGHPAPIFVRRAVRLLEMDFLQIIAELAPDALPRVHDLGGIVPSE
jgi:type VI secretion system protein ImpA